MKLIEIKVDTPMSKKMKKQWQDTIHLWCDCDFLVKESPFDNAMFADDGLCKCGVHKHHWHCGHCGKLLQIG